MSDNSPSPASGFERDALRPQVAIFDTAAASRNLGDQIIMDAVHRQLRAITPEAFFVSVPTHEIVGPQGKALIRESAATVVGGTNLLSSAMNKYAQWKVGLRELRWLRDVILLGVGWWQYQHEPNAYTRMLLNRFLHHGRPHSLRDGYTARRLAGLGFDQALNTSCVTLWEMTPERQAAIPQQRSGSVVATLTDYKPAPEADIAFLQMLQARYENVFLWIQGARDFAYIRSLGLAGIELVDPQLAAYDQLLESGISLDYVGTRLHAGVRALSRGRRSIILGVDNRATEISSDTGLTVISRDAGVNALEAAVTSEFDTRLDLPWELIERWRQGFRAETGLSGSPPPMT